jgi:two-component system nitrate/nitrite response regulator NarL
MPLGRRTNRVAKVLVAEANEMNCQLVQTAFRPRGQRISVVAVATSSARALELLQESQPDVAVVSSRLQEGPLEGFRLLRSIRSLSLKVRIVLLLDSREREMIVDAFRFGAHGVIFRDEPIEALAKCIHAVRDGQVWANSEHLQYLLQALTRAMPPVARTSDGLKLLTRRELDIVSLVAEGFSNREVSNKLGLSEHTVRNYMFHIFDKLGVSTRVELVLYCLNKLPAGSVPAAARISAAPPSHD